MIRLMLATLMCLFLVGCEKREVFGEKRIVMEVVAVHLSSKTNSTVDLREIATGYVYKRQRLACSSQKAKRIKVGSKWDVTEVTYIYPESQRYTSSLVETRTICSLSN